MRVRRDETKRCFYFFRLKWGNDILFKYIPQQMRVAKRPKSLLQSQNEWYSKKEKLSINTKHFLLINPPVEDTIEYKVSSCKHAYPTGILRIAHYLTDKGHKIHFFDFNPMLSTPKFVRKAKCGDGRIKNIYYYGLSYKAFKKKIEFITDVVDEVFITTIMTYHYSYTLKKIVAILQNRFPKVKIKVGGIYASLCPEEINKIDGVEVHIGPYEDADTYYPLIELLDYKPETGVLRLIKGCPFKCSYCAVHILEKEIKRFDLRRLINEFHYYFKNGIMNYTFWDSNLFFAKKDFLAFLDYLVKYGYAQSVSLDLSYGIQMDLLCDKVLHKLNKINLKGAFALPLESAVKKFYYYRFHKDINHLKHIKKAAQCINKILGQRCSFYVLAGMPDQTLADIVYSLYFGLIQNWTSVALLFTPIPKTEEFIRYHRLIKDKPSWELNPNLFPCASKHLTSTDLQDILNFFWCSYLVRKGNKVFIRKYDRFTGRFIDYLLDNNNRVLRCLRRLIGKKKNLILKEEI